MNRACFGSAMFLSGLLVSLLAPSLESVAQADPVSAAGAAPRLGTSAKGKLVAPARPEPARPEPARPEPARPEPASAAASQGRCAEGMVEVAGDYCPALEQRCVRWLDPEKTSPRRCAEFAPSGACQTKTVRKRFCIDKFEYPNKPGERPVVMKTWVQAREACRAEGKRLCGDSEWTLACEGQRRLPYPYGLQRSADACNIDKPHPAVNEGALADPRTRDAEVARLWQGESSGARAACVSSYGVFDMTGNVDEWVVNERGVPFKSALKGGYWGPVRDRCRPTTTAHGEDFAFYQIGFRCCADAP